MSNNQTQMLNWFVNNQGTSVGPMSAEQLQNDIASGKITRGMHVYDDKSQWMLIEQSPFACWLPQSKKVLILKVGAVLAVAAITLTLGVALIDYIDSEDKKREDKRQVASSGALSTGSSHFRAPAPAPAPAKPDILERLATTSSLNTAIVLLRPYMEDTRNGTEPLAAALLAMWMNTSVQWSMLENMPDSKRAEAIKDPESFRGHRICVSGSVVEIHADHSAKPPIFNGGIMTSSRDVVRFYAVRSTSKINEDSVARFCGIITGTQSYSNNGGGTTHALLTVGMFDIPENHEDKTSL